MAIVGAGYRPLDRLLPEAPGAAVARRHRRGETAGFGASGRNGGWLMGNLLGEDGLLAGLPPGGAGPATTCCTGFPTKSRVLQEEGIDCDYRKGGVLYCAALPEQERRLRAYLHDLYAEGWTKATTAG